MSGDHGKDLFDLAGVEIIHSVDLKCGNELKGKGNVPKVRIAHSMRSCDPCKREESRVVVNVRGHGFTVPDPRFLPG